MTVELGQREGYGVGGNRRRYSQGRRGECSQLQAALGQANAEIEAPQNRA